MKPLVKHILRVTAIVLVAVILGLVVWIMLNRIGLSDSLDFGAGAYYYADILRETIIDEGLSPGIILLSPFSPSPSR